MNKFLGILLATTLVSAAILAPTPAAARSGGGGGGTETGTPFVFDHFTSINGTLPTWTGTYSITNSIPGYYTWSTVSISIKGKPMNVSDGTSFRVTLYTSNVDSGAALAPVSLPNLVVISKTGTLKGNFNILNAPNQNINRRVDGIVVSATDGTVIAAAHS